MEFFDHGVGMVIVRRSPPAFGELARPWRLGLSRCTMQTMSSSQAKRSRGANPTRNDIAITAFREGKLPFPDGAIIVALHWNESLSDENNKVLAIGFPNAALQSSVAGSAENVQFMVKDSKKYAATDGWGYADFKNGKPGDEALLKTCHPCHQPAKNRDFVFTRYAPTP
jgi:hypothetical protein